MGYFKFDKPMGDGTVRWLDLDCEWEGQFDEGEFDGDGVLTLSDGTTLDLTLGKSQWSSEKIRQIILKHI